MSDGSFELIDKEAEAEAEADDPQQRDQKLWEKYSLYLIRWQLSTPVLWGVLYLLRGRSILLATILANLIGGLIFFWVDRAIFIRSQWFGVIWDVREKLICYDCGKTGRCYRIVRYGIFDWTTDKNPKWRCEKCSSIKAERLGVR